jgi:hypothetical protein
MGFVLVQTTVIHQNALGASDEKKCEDNHEYEL